jgi:hypothetical protein
MKRLIFAIALLALPLGAQEQKKEEPKPQEPRIQKVFVLKYVDPAQMARVLGPFGAILSFDTSLRTLTVSATTASMPGIEEAVKRLDVPSAVVPALLCGVLRLLEQVRVYLLRLQREVE